MLRYQLLKTVDGQEQGGKPETVQVGVVALSDNARGADEYLMLKRRGFELQRLDYQPVEDR